MKNFLIIILLFIFNSAFTQEMTLDWQSCYGSEGAGDNSFWALENMPNGNIIGCVNVYGENSAFTNYHGNYDAWVLIFDLEGNIINELCFGGNEYDIFVDIEIFEDNIFFYGITYSIDGDAQSPSINDNGDLWVVKTDFNLNILWERKYGCLGTILSKSAKATPSGGLVDQKAWND